MTNLGKRLVWLAIALGLTVTWTSGCQTYFPDTGQTLPTGNYLNHPPQYIPRSPAFPLAREETDLERATIQPSGLPPQ